MKGYETDSYNQENGELVERDFSLKKADAIKKGEKRSKDFPYVEVSEITYSDYDKDYLDSTLVQVWRNGVKTIK